MSAPALLIPKRNKRAFLPEDFRMTDWNSVKPYFDELKKREIEDAPDLKEWFADRSELESCLSEDFAWRYIRMTCDTAEPKLVEDLNFFIEEIQPRIAPESDELNKRALHSPFLNQLTDPGYHILTRSLKKEVEIFREENVPLLTEIQTEERKYGAVAGGMTVEIDGRELTLQQASDYLQSTDRAKREEAWRKVQDRRLQDKDQLDNLYNKLISLRHRVAANAGFANYRDYMFTAMGRFDYTPQDCLAFHQSVREAVVPLLDGLVQERKTSLQLDSLRPWDLRVDVTNQPPLKPFDGGEDLLEKTIQCFRRLDPYLAECLMIMREMGHLDLVSRKGKAPGGYNYPLDETGVPFIFMNATSTLRDMVTILHEGGHAVHSFVTRNLPVNAFKHPPSEVAELASMSMELISMDEWDIFFPDPDDLKRAKRQHLEGIIETLPWVATIDKFQHWIYEHPQHTVEDRKRNWLDIYGQFTDKVTDWSGLIHFKEYIWQKQLHLYEVPFYYIEYGIAQLGAVAVWKRFRQNPKEGLEGYMNALKLGYTRPVRQIYEAAGIPFDFSREYITELMTFVREELEKAK